MDASPFKFDEIGYWSEVKLEIIRRYATEYSKILSAPHQQRSGLSHYYVDAFSGAGQHISKRTGEFVLGSPLNALNVKPPFKGYYFIDLNPKKTEYLRESIGEREDVLVLHGDCNEKLLTEVFPNVSFPQRRRALCVLDPYGLHLNWEVMFKAGQMRSIEIFLNFPIMDMNQNVLWRKRDLEAVDEKREARMTAFWGDESWQDAAYAPTPDMFGRRDKTTNEAVVSAFRERLRHVAGFKYVPDPIPMRNSTNAVIYYLFFASPNDTGRKIVEHVFDMFRDKRME